ncbi:MAG TPA: MazG family protein, partial [Planococcus sp. (in: firmicutes)]|nr:MazG family protein [Planococcus sp. (in: firmicutes)]
AQIAQDSGYFQLEDVLESISAKMIHRHPHVFGNVEVDSADDVVANWQAIKDLEKKSQSSILEDQERFSSSLTTSFNYQKKAAKVGFSWPDTSGAWDKFNEELQEFQEETAKGSKAAQLDELGDLLFTLVNLARYYGLSPEEAMVQANRKFRERFEHVEKQVNEGTGNFSDYSLEQLDQFWNEAKSLAREEESS